MSRGLHHSLMPRACITLYLGDEEEISTDGTTHLDLEASQPNLVDGMGRDEKGRGGI
jgi:hypothetical protein